jgi:diguanylate cyclase (GGDEF)-like protein/PAS domain S-box-containing protein
MNLLIVDDNPTNLKLLHAQLESEGYTVIDAADGVEALDVLRRKPIDAVISDILMPNMDGYKLCLEIRKSDRFGSLPFVFYTSTYNSAQDRELAKSVGADQYVVKPSPLPVIVEALHQAARKVREPSSPTAPEPDEADVLKQYSGALVRKLEEKNLELELANEQLREKEAGLRRAQLMAKLTQIITGPDGSFETWSETLPQLIGLEPAGMPRSTREWLDLLHPDDRAMFREKAISAGVTGARTDVEYRLRRNDGVWVQVRQVMEPLQDQTDPHSRQRWFNTIQDVTEQRQAERKIQRLNRVYAVLSGINALIVRARDRQELFDEACRIAVENGNFGMAWIGEYDKTTLEVTPVAWMGFDEGTALVKASARDDIPEGQGMVGRAIRGKKPVITNDIGADLGAGGPRRDEALRKDLHSIISMPLMVEGETAATLTLFAKERNFFNEEELKLLTELAGDISFALGHLAKAKQLAYIAYHDTLTGLPNRTLFLERVSQALHAATQSSRRLALVIGDLKRFRLVNETLGRHGGDDLLKQIAERMHKSAHNTENLARIAGDSFSTFMADVQDPSEVVHLIEKFLLKAFQQPFQVEGQELTTSLVLGIAMYPNDGGDAETLFRNAEAALKKAKTSGDAFLFYEPSINAKVADSLKLENKLHRAIEAEQFVLHYQPKLDTKSGSIDSVEALIRWRDPETGLVPPGQFIPILEETGRILEVGLWAIRRALLDRGRWRAVGLRAPRIAVNVSAIQLQQKDFVDAVRSIIAESHASNDLPGGGLDLEITESLIMRDIGEIVPRLKALRESGVDIMVDDFGTGHSSLGYLARLPLTALKIDRSFVDGMSENAESMTIVSSIISLAHSLNLKVIAEGVETEEQAKMLRLFRCDQLQGYLLGRPAPFEAVSALLPRAN